jgi:predicted branched-subunit amino acid permease
VRHAAAERRAIAGYLAGARSVAPLVPVIAVLGVVIGYVSVATGLSPAAAALMSATTFAGSSQLAALSVVREGGTIAAAAAGAALLAARYLAMGSAASPALGGAAWKRAVLAQLAVDESWAVAYEGDGRFSRARLIGAGLLLYVAHVVATTAGAVAGHIVDPGRWGLDAAFPALFVLLLWPHLARRDARVVAALGATIALSLTPATPPGIPVTAAALAALLGVRRR